jgi:hypothetical protein
MDIHTFYGLFHVFVATPFLIYVGIVGTKVPSWIYGILALLVVGMVGYHGWRAFQKFTEGRSAWVNWIHLLFIVPLLAWIAVQQKETPRRAFEMVLMLGFAGLGYHGYYLFLGTH